MWWNAFEALTSRFTQPAPRITRPWTLLTRQTARRLTRIDAQIPNAPSRVIDTAAAALIEADLDSRHAILGSTPRLPRNHGDRAPRRHAGTRHGGAKDSRQRPPAMAAARVDADLRAERQARVEAGKPAVTAVMRKLVVRANALPCNDRPWTPQPARPSRIL